MEYIDKLKKIQGNLDNLENKTKGEIIEFAKLVVRMSISKEEGNQYADELMRHVNEQEVDNMVKASVAIAESGTNNFNLLHQFESITGFKLDENLLQDLANGTVEVKRLKGE
ncbi:hypothetical protein [Vagococcus carniphilus]|uniref:hypothetical protein n=1 Tax=Vagococcus carniphilus TaxID=218144 RepID=UPI002891AC2F|nr:hypothetical protein [Vagococcus carniphilus]MDT2864675.1 hypothetical protein [Vagococcus carniphilus]